MQIVIENKENLIEKIKKFLHEDFVASLENTDLDEDEKNANIILGRKKMQENATHFANIIYKAYGLE